MLGVARWSHAIPWLLARNIARPGAVAASLQVFEEAFPNATAVHTWFARLRNRYFWVIPISILLLLASLLVRTRRPFEPLPEDLAPPRGVRALAVALPGIAQFMTGRSIRGVLLAAPAIYVAQTIYHDLVLKEDIFAGLIDFRRVPHVRIAALVAESPSAIAAIHERYRFELMAILLAIYVLHWIDLLAARGRARRRAREKGETEKPIVVQLDSSR